MAAPAVVTRNTEARSAPFAVAPVVQSLADGTPLSANETASNGWRRVELPGGKFGYVLDTDLNVDLAQIKPAAPPPDAPPPPPSATPRAVEGPAAAPEIVPSRARGLLIIPFAGVHLIEGIAADDFDPGARVGVILGRRMGSAASLNVEIATNFLSPKSDPGVTNPLSGRDTTIAFSPLFHASGPVGELVVGPKLGYWSLGLEGSSSVSGVDNQLSQTGWAFGFNLGAFANAGDLVALGALLSYQMTYVSQTCVRGPNVSECVVEGAFPPQILGLTGAALF